MTQSSVNQPSFGERLSSACDVYAAYIGLDEGHHCRFYR
jgi:hypothetical protein